MRIKCEKRYLFFSFLVCSFLLNYRLYAQNERYLFSRISNEQGLSNNSAQIILQDSKGFIWIGTRDGLNRFDGHYVKVFKNNTLDSSSLATNMINFLFEDQEKKIWAGSSSKLCVYDPFTEKFSYDHKVFHNKVPIPRINNINVLGDKHGNIWFMNSVNGIFKYDFSKDSVIQIFHIPGDTTSISSNDVTFITEDQDHNYWIMNLQGMLEKLDNKSLKVIKRIRLPVQTNVLYSIFIDSDGDVWIYSPMTAQGVFFYDTKKNALRLFNTYQKESKLNSNMVFEVIQDNEGIIWIATDHGGINLLNKKDFSIQYIIHNPINRLSLSDNSVIDLYKDRRGIIWLGTNKNGICYYDKKHYKFQLITHNPDDKKSIGFNDIDNFIEDKKGNLWIGTNGGGLIYYDRTNSTFKQYRHEVQNPNSISSDIIVSMYLDHKDRLWIGTYFGGLNCFYGSGFRQYKNNPFDPFSITDNRIWDIYEDSNKNFWIATLKGGVCVFNPENGKVIKQYRASDPINPIASDVTFDIAEDKNKNIWIATGGGLSVYIRETGKIVNYIPRETDTTSLSADIVYDVMVDSKNRVWAGTRDGLNLLNEDGLTFVVLREKDGLPSNTVKTMVEDYLGRIWLGTNNGISCLTIKKDNKNGQYNFTFKNFDQSDGLQGREFNEKSSYLTRHGELFFGGPQGINSINANDLKSSLEEPDIVFTELQVFNKNIGINEMVNGRVILERSLTCLSEITLQYRENVITISFADLGSNFALDKPFRYKMEGFNNEWLYTDKSIRKATYTNLNPGQYIFKVQTVNSDGSWNEITAALKITVLAPWWKTIWFRLFIVMCIIFIGMLIYKMRVANLKAHKNSLENKVMERTNELQEVFALMEEKQEEITSQNNELAMHRSNLEKLVQERTSDFERAMKKAEESDRLKSAFLANMSHEIRTPMNAIIGFSSMLKVNKDEVKRNRYADIISLNCSRLLDLINDILDISVIEANQLKIRKSIFAVDTILKDMETLYRSNNIKNIDIQFINTKQKSQIILNNDPFRFQQIFSNLLSNALKFTEEGQIRFGYTIIDEKVQFYISDTGIGIKKDEVEFVFDHFRKVDHISKTKLYSGIGIGLSITQKLIQLMGGTIWLESEEGKGTTFYFNLPYTEFEQVIKISDLAVKSEKVNTLNLTNVTVLVAEDEEANMFLLKELLEPYGAEIIWARDGKELVQYLTNIKPEDNCIVLMDIKMPLMNGIEALKTIREKLKNIPVIAVTAYAQDDEKHEVLEYDFDDFIPKPVKKDELIASISRFL